MITYIVLLRAVNVGGHGEIAMAGIQDCLHRAGFMNVRTVLQSGNVLLGNDEKQIDRITSAVELALLETFSLRTEAMVRSASQWKRWVAGNPFPDAGVHDPSHLVALLTKQPVDQTAVTALRIAVRATGGNEQVGFHGGQLYATYPDGIGDSRLTTPAIERATKCPVTARNWNTVLKLAAMCLE